MCPWKEDRSRAGGGGLMADEIWEAVRPHLPETTSVDFTGGGEPLLHPRLAAWIRQAGEAGCETGFLTSGLLLGEDKAREVVAAGTDWIGFSIDGASAAVYEKIRPDSDFGGICRNVSRLAALRGEGPPMIMINFVVMKENVNEIEDIIHLALRLGADQVNYKQCDVVRGKEGRSHGLFEAEESARTRGLEKRLAKARSLAGRRGIRTTAFAFSPQELPVCAQDPRSSIFVRHDGMAAPCINLALGGPSSFLGREITFPAVSYGSLPGEDLFDLWQGATCRGYREVFERRVEAHEKRLLGSLGGSTFDRRRILDSARDAMPEAPEGCRTCHYLFDI